MKMYQAVVEEMGGEITSPLFDSKEDLFEWARVLGFKGGSIFEIEVKGGGKQGEVSIDIEYRGKEKEVTT